MRKLRPQYLTRRNGIYYLRLRVPDNIREKIGLTEIRRSIQAYKLRTAKTLAAKLIGRLFGIFEMANSSGVGKSDIREMIKACFAEIATDADHGFTPKQGGFSEDFEYQKFCWDEMKQEVSHQIATQVFSTPVTETAMKWVAKHGVDWSTLSDQLRYDMYEGVARAFLEQHKMYMFRLEDRLTPYTPFDTLFHEYLPVASSNKVRAPLPAMNDLARVDVKLSTETLKYVVDDYIHKNRSLWSPKTFKSVKLRLGYLTDFLGEDVPFNSITASDIRNFADGLRKLARLPLRHPGLKLQDKFTEDAKLRIAPKTARSLLATPRAMFKWATTKNAYIDKNPAEFIQIDLPKPANKTARTRRPFTAHELNLIFKSPEYSGCRSRAVRNRPGKYLAKDDRYWIPLLGYFTGARLGEIIQMHLQDINIDCEIPHINITDENSGPFGTDSYKSAKNDASLREIPLHPDLMAIGFGDFVRKRKNLKRPTSKRLFHNIKFGADGQASTLFSRKFSEWLKAIDLADATIVFHSFRHNMKDALLNSNTNQQIIERIMGHSNNSVNASYGIGPSLITKFEAIKITTYLVDVRKILNENEANLNR